MLIRKQYLEKIRRFYESNLIKVLTGVRRCGKSVLLNQIKDELINENGIEENHIISINFEDVQFAHISTFNQLNDFILTQIKDEGKYYIFLDEIQYVKEFEKTLASLKATKNVSLFVTGSNSKLLSGRLASLLVGRCKEFKIMPFTYSELMEYYQEKGLEMPNKPLQDFIKFGGMPQRLDYSLEEDIKEYLKALYYGIIDKDICNDKSKIDKETFITISKYIISNTSKEFSANRIVDYYNKNNSSKIYRENVYRYLEKLEQACLISRVKRYDIAAKRTLKSIEKQFVVDNGFLLACSDSNQIFVSHALENIIHNELLFRGYDIRIGKTYKGEIDFVAIKDGKKCFIQVAYLLSSDDVIEREFGAFASVRDSSPKYVLSLDDYDMSREGITHLNIEDWLLNKVDITLS
ncbi:MAG TPA: ATP-binding protein [Bacilli bacterium]|nr:MAG: Archaeal ATPase [Tenericutes bacterium ADurb.BinA124]HNZ49904.1 ATP-binding protein [Bacilli bacterium]HOH17709.1 ATP-binding protein [Bacilli bacterium]HPX84224.1 ATP-binding protein [Bacilli bacterium]HQC74145.1 ATP-binding protein [Bacilli bacterium]